MSEANSKKKKGAKKKEMARKENNVKSIMIQNQFPTEYWNWSQDELKSVINKDIYGITNIVKNRLESSGIEIEGLYSISHDKDILIDNKGIIEHKPEHIHIIINFKERTNTITQIAKIVGLRAECIEKGKSGRYSWDNFLSYLIHAKNEDKAQYHVDEVYTLIGNDYKDVEIDRRDSWRSGRVAVTTKNAKDKSDELHYMLMNGEISIEDVIDDQHGWFQTYGLDTSRFDRAYDAHLIYRARQVIKAFDSGMLDTRVYFITGKAGSGKTRMSKTILQQVKSERPNARIFSCAATNPVDNYKGEEIVFMDDLRGNAFTASDWLKMLDPHNTDKLSARYRNVSMGAVAIIITASISEHEFFYYVKNKNHGNEAMDQFIRRLHMIIEVINADEVYVRDMLVDVPPYCVEEHIRNPYADDSVHRYALANHEKTTQATKLHVSSNMDIVETNHQIERIKKEIIEGVDKCKDVVEKM